MNPAHEAKRAKDSDRTDAVEVIDAAYADGQLSPAEREQRTHSALTAATLGELHRLTSDLQAVPGPVAAAVRRPRVLAVVAAVLLVVAGGYAVLRGGDDEPRQEARQEAAPPAEAEPVEEPVEVADPPVIEELPLEYSFTPEGVRNFRQLHREKFGTTKALAFGFADGEVDIARQTPDGPWHWQFVDGHFVDAGSYSDGDADGVQDRSFPPGSVDLADLDIDAMFRNLSAVEQATGRTTFPTRGTSVVVDRGGQGVYVVAGERYTSSCLVWWTTMSGKVLQDNIACD